MMPNCKQQKKDVKFLANNGDEHIKPMKDVTLKNLNAMET